MDRDYESRYHELEASQWWFEARRDMVIRLMRKIDKKANILEVGCSGGCLIKDMKDYGFERVSGVDISKAAIEVCEEKGIKSVYLRDGIKTGFNDSQFDVVISSDVLEHIQDEVSALREWNRILKPGGILILFVPAFSFLWGEHDDANNHYRRYAKQGLIFNTERAYFKIERASYWNCTLFFPVALFRALKRILWKGSKTNQQDRLYRVYPIRGYPIINKILMCVLKFENRVLEISNLPIGVSIFVVAKKS
jgi:SAM-dependent methyltransferase